MNDPYPGGQPPYGGGQPPYGGGQPPYNPNWAPSSAPAPSRTGAGPIVAVFVGVLITLALIAGVIVFLNQPPPPEAPCSPGQPCAPVPSLQPVPSSPVAIPTLKPVPSTTTASVGPTLQPSATPKPGETVPPPPPATPTSDSPPVVTGTLYTDASLGYSFEYDPEIFTLAQSADGSAVFTGNFFDAQVWIDAKAADTSVAKMIKSELEDIDRFLIARVPDTDTYDALLGPSIGYVPGDGGVWSGTLVSRDGTPLAPGGVTIAAASDGRITVAVVIIVGSPDLQQSGDTQQHAVRQAADDLLKSFNWSAQ